MDQLFSKHDVTLFTDVDECADGTASCVPDANCTNTEGGYVCQCGFGYNGDGRNSGTGCISQSITLSLLIQRRHMYNL